MLDTALRGQTEDQLHPSTRRATQRQRRLTQSDVIQLAQEYTAGSTVNQLANKYSVHRTTVLAHLERQHVDRRRITRRLTDADVEDAARLYEAGNSLKATARRFEVDAETLRREFARAGIQTRPRRGWMDPSQARQSPPTAV